MSGDLTVEQRQRTDALRVAREVIIHRRSSSPVAVSLEVDVLDLIAVARFILTGVDPYAPDTDDEPPARLVRVPATEET